MLRVSPVGAGALLFLLATLITSSLSSPPIVMVYTNNQDDTPGSFTGFVQSSSSLDPIGTPTPIDDEAAPISFSLNGECAYLYTADFESTSVTYALSLWDPKQGPSWPTAPFNVTLSTSAVVMKVNSDPQLNEVFLVWAEADPNIAHFISYSTIQWNQCNDFVVSNSAFAVNSIYDASSRSFLISVDSGFNALSTVDGTQTFYGIQADFNLSSVQSFAVDGSSENIAFVLSVANASSDAGYPKDFGVSTLSCSDDDQVCEFGTPYFTLGADVTRWTISAPPQYDPDAKELYVVLTDTAGMMTDLRVYDVVQGVLARRFSLPPGSNVIWFNLCRN